jgi:hypothetical protein
MAKIEQTELFRFANFDPAIKARRVGANRMVTHRIAYTTETRENGEEVTVAFADEIVGSLHGHEVFRARKYRKWDGLRAYELRLDTCGYYTATTRAAMADFCKAAGLRVMVSMAGGQLSAALCHPLDGQNSIPCGGSIARAYMKADEWAEFNDLEAV